jgi:gas vesicle protein
MPSEDQTENTPSEDAEQQPSLAIRAAADAVVFLAGARLGGVDGAALAVAVTPYAEKFLRRALGEFKQDAQRRVTEMLESTAEASKCNAEELADRIGDSERTRLLTASATAAAVNSAWPPKVHALGRALADGLIAADEAEANIADLVIPPVPSAPPPVESTQFPPENQCPAPVPRPAHPSNRRSRPASRPR